MRSVTDGDTIVLENGERVRLIGVDTPEIDDDRRNRSSARSNRLDEKIVRGYAAKAKTFTAGLVEKKQVLLEYDWQRKDKYGRTLAYVYRGEDGLFVNAEIIRQGYGFPLTWFPFKHRDSFRKLRDEASDARRGLWQ